MADTEGRKAGLMQLLRAQATQLLGEVEALTGGEMLSKDQKAMMPLDLALRDLQSYQVAEDLEAAEFAQAHKRLTEIRPQVKQVVDSMDDEQAKKYAKKAEKKVMAQTLKHREKLQAQFNEVAALMPDEQKHKLGESMKRMPVARQEQFIAELVSKHQRRQQMSESERQEEDQEMLLLHQTWQALLESLDSTQRPIMRNQLANMLPSAQIAYMKKVISDGGAEVIPPSKEEMSEWKAFYLSYFNSSLSVKNGRMLPLEYCVRNPRPDELMEAFRALQIRAIFEARKQRPNDNLNLGRFKFQLKDSNGNLVNAKYTSKRQIMKLVGKQLVDSAVRKDPVTAAVKEKEGVFDFDSDMEQIEKAMQQAHGPTAGQAQAQAQAQVKADKKKNKKQRR